MAKRRFARAPTRQPIEDLTGFRYPGSKLVALRPYTQRNAAGKICWICRCDCGIEIAADAVDLKRGRVKSCGCGFSEAQKRRHKQTD